MKSIFMFLISLILLSCCSVKNLNDSENCNENKKFKELFFYNINYIEKNITVRQDETFRNSLLIISKYTHVSFDKMMNYSNTYPYGVFLKDKEIWLKWYDENKCNNIQLID